MPFLVDGAPPVDPATLNAARHELPREYGVRVVTQRGRKAVLVRVPRPKPDYNYELAVVAFYATLDDVKDAKDVLLIGDEKVVRMEPLRLRDHVREQAREDKETAPQLRARLAREYGWMVHQSASNHHHRALAIRLPVETIGQLNETLLLYARAAIGAELVNALSMCQYVYLFADHDFARVGRRVFVETVTPDLAAQLGPREEKTANPLHLSYQTPGGFLKGANLPRG